MRSLPLLVALVAALGVPSALAQADDAVLGAWAAEEPYFRARLLIERDGDGALAAFFADEDLSRGAPLSSAVLRGDSLFLAADAVGAAFRGRVAGGAIAGTWTQGEAAVALTLRPVAIEAPARPQEPTGPFPYAEAEVAVASPTGASLAGTLTVPDGAGPFPGVVLLVGSGPLGRDAEVGGHRPFAVLADRLARTGVAALRYDKRPDADLDGRTQDAAAALAWLRDRPEVDAARVGLLGHSEGGLVATRALGDDGAFLVLLGTPALPLAASLAEQNAALLTASGAPTNAADAARALWSRVATAAASEADSAAVATEIRAALAGQGWTGEALDASVAVHSSATFRTLMRHDPGPALRAVRVPALALVGSLDLATPPALHADALRQGLGDRGTVRVVDGVNHWLQPATTGLPDEIERIETTIAEPVLALVIGWIGDRAAGATKQ